MFVKKWTSVLHSVVSAVVLVTMMLTSISTKVAAQGGTVGDGYLCTASDSRREPQSGMGGLKYTCVLNADGKYRWTSASAAPPSPAPANASTPIPIATDPAPINQITTEPTATDQGFSGSGPQTYINSNEAQLVIGGVPVKVTPAAKGGVYFPFGYDNDAYKIVEECSGIWIWRHCFPVTKIVSQSELPKPPGNWLPEPIGYDTTNQSWSFVPAAAVAGWGAKQTIQVTSWGSAEIALGGLSIAQPIIIVGCTLQTLTFVFGDQSAPYEGVPAIAVPIPPIQWSLEDYVARPGIAGKTISNQYSGYSYVISSMPNKCTTWFKAHMPKSDWSELLEFEEKSEHDDTPCNVFTIITQMMKIGVKASQAGVGLQFIKEFYVQVFTEIVKDLGLPQSGDYIIKLLGW